VEARSSFNGRGGVDRRFCNLRTPDGGFWRTEPVHVHVRRDQKEAKFWLAPVDLGWNAHNHGA
jgi:hypothetical protein